MPGGSSFIGGGGNLDPKKDRLGAIGPPPPDPADKVVAINTYNGAVTPAGTYQDYLNKRKTIADAQAAARAPGAADLAKAQALRDALVAQSQGLKPRTAPQVDAAPVVNAAQAGPVQLGSAVLPQAARAEGPMMVDAPTMDAAMAANARDVLAPTVRAASANAPDKIAVDQVATARIGQPILQGTAIVNPFEGAQSVDAKRVAIDRAQSDQLRLGQNDLISLLQAQANGTGPSAAQALQQKAIDQAIGTQRSLAGGTRGPGRIAAALRASQNIAQLTGQGAADSAALRAREMQEGRTALGTALTAARGQDISLATAQGQLSNATELQNAALGTQANITNTAQRTMQNVEQARLVQLAAAGNQAAQNEIRIRQAELEQQATNLTTTARLGAAQSNQGADLQTALANAGFEQGAGLANASNNLEAARANQGADLQTNIANAGFRQGANQTNATLGLSAAQGNQRSALDTALANAGFVQGANLAGAAAQNQFGLAQGSMDLQTSLANAGFQQQAGITNAENTIGVNKTNATLGQNQISLDDTRQAQQIQAALQAQGQVLQTDDARAKNALLQQQINAAIKSGDRSFLQSVLGTVLSVAGGVGGFLLSGGNPLGAIAGAGAGKYVGGVIGGEGNS